MNTSNLPSMLPLLILVLMGAMAVVVYRAAAKKRRDAAASTTIGIAKKPRFLDIDESGGFRGMKAWPEIVRWLAVLPFAVLGLLLMTTMLRFFVSVLHLGDNETLGLLLGVVGSFLSHLGFVLGGWAAAPRARVPVAVLLGIGLMAMDSWLVSHGLSWVGMFGGLCGAAVATWYAFKSHPKLAGAGVA